MQYRISSCSFVLVCVMAGWKWFCCHCAGYTVRNIKYDILKEHFTTSFHLCSISHWSYFESSPIKSVNKQNTLYGCTRTEHLRLTPRGWLKGELHHSYRSTTAAFERNAPTATSERNRERLDVWQYHLMHFLFIFIFTPATYTFKLLLHLLLTHKQFTQAMI